MQANTELKKLVFNFSDKQQQYFEIAWQTVNKQTVML